MFYDNKMKLLETINHEASKNITILTEENEYYIRILSIFYVINSKLKASKDEMKEFYTQKLLALETLWQTDKPQEEPSFISDRVSNFQNKQGFLESFHRKNMNSDDFQYFKNSVLCNLQNPETKEIPLNISILGMKSLYIIVFYIKIYRERDQKD